MQTIYYHQRLTPSSSCYLVHCPYPLSAGDIAEVYDDVHIRRPLLELFLPGSYCGQWHHEEEWTIHLVLVE